MISGNSGALAGENGDADRNGSSNWALASLALSMMLASLGTSIANVGLPSLAQAFGASFQQAQWVVLAYLLAITVLIVGVGRLGDLIGRRRLMLIGLCIFTLASMLCGAAPSLDLLIAGRAVQGLGAAIMMTLTLAFVAGTVAPHKTGSAMGLLGTMSAIGTALGPALGGILIATLGWRAMFLINVPLGLLALAVARRYLPAELPVPVAAHTGFDVPGLLLLAASLACYALAMTIGRGNFGALNLALLSIAVLGAAAFVLVESRSVAPLIQMALFRNPLLGAGFASSAIVMSVMMSTLVVGPFYLSGALLLDPTRVGLVMATGPVVSAFSGLPAGRLVDRFGAARISLFGLTAMATGALALALLPTTLGSAAYVLPLIVVTAGYAVFQAANNTAVMTSTSADQRGLVSGLLNLSRNLGLITGASAMGAVFAWSVRALDIASAGPAAIATGMRTTFAVATVLVLAALAIAIGGRGGSARHPLEQAPAS